MMLLEEGCKSHANQWKTKMPRGMKLGTVVSRVDRYAAVKLRQRIREEIIKSHDTTYTSLFSKFMLKGWLPNKETGDPLEDFGFRRHFNTVKKDLNHGFSGFFICFLSRSAVGAYKDLRRKGPAPQAYNGTREIAMMTGLQETTIRDMLILNGEIR